MSTSGVDVRASPAVPFLLDCIHDSAFTAPPTEPLRALRLVERLLTNVLQHPADPRYRSFSATSAAWVDGVLPHVHVLRLTAWMGCAVVDSSDNSSSSSSSRYTFLPASGSAADRLDELRCVIAVWDDVATHDESHHMEDARRHMHTLFLATRGAVVSEAVWTRYTGDLHLRRLLAYNDSRPAGPPPPVECATPRWTARAQLALQRPFSGDAAPDALELRAAQALAVCLAETSVQWVLAHTSLRALHSLCESAAAVVTASASRGRDSADAAATTAPPLQRSSSLAQRLRQRALQEQHQRYLDSTGPAYRALTHEERHRGESAIVGVAALLEQLAAVTEAQGMVRQDRREARRLLDEFRRDGDLAKLYRLEEQLTEAVEEAKRVHGKPLLYATSWGPDREQDEE